MKGSFSTELISSHAPSEERAGPAIDPEAELRRCVRDLVTLSSLHALWGKRSPREIAQNLCDVLLSTLRLDPVYIVLTGAPGEAPVTISSSLRMEEETWAPQVRRTVEKWWKAQRYTGTFSIPLPGRKGDTQIVVTPVGFEAGCGLIAVGSERVDFPNEIDRLFLSVCAHQTAIAAQNYSLLEVAREKSFLKDKLLERERLARAEAEEREERFRLLMEGVKDYAIVMLDPDGRVLDWNSGAERVFGYGAKEIAGKSVARFYPKNRGEDAEHHLRAALEAGRFEVEDWRMRRDGTFFFAHVILTALKNGEGATRGFAQITRDTTQRRVAEMALRQSEEGFRKIFEESPVGMALIGPDLRFHRANPAFTGMLGVTEKKLKKLSLNDVTRPGDVEVDGELVQKLYRGEMGRYQVEKRLKTAGRKLIWVNLAFSLIREDGDKILYKLVIAENVTARKMAEDQVYFQASLLDQVCNAVIATDSEGRIIFWNRHAEKLFLWKRDEILGKEALDLLVPKNKEKEAAQLRSMIAEDGCWEGEFTVRRKDKSVFETYVQETPVRNACGEKVGFVCVVNDITERKAAEGQLRKSQEQMRALTAHLHWVREKERSHIAREIHDELGQALTGLKMDLSWIDHRLAEAKGGNGGDRVKDKINSMSLLIDSTIHQVRKITTELRPRILDELGLIAAIEWQTREFQTRTGIKCTFEANVDHIPLDDDRSTAIFRIFQETLTNVLRHAKGSKVSSSMKLNSGGLTLEVSDNGKGISREKIFDPQSLGLLGMRERALLSGGKLSIVGLQGKGTTVTVWLPFSGKRIRGNNRERQGRADRKVIK